MLLVVAQFHFLGQLREFSMAIYYSASKKGFYHDFMEDEYQKAGSWPDDLKEISERWFNYLLDKQADGKLIVANEYGLPVSESQNVYWKGKAENEMQRLVLAAYSEIDDWKIELQLGILTEDGKARLAAWMVYIKEIKIMDFSMILNEQSFNNIKWPVRPL